MTIQMTMKIQLLVSQAKSNAFNQVIIKDFHGAEVIKEADTKEIFHSCCSNGS
jgi:hypothetical protein